MCIHSFIRLIQGEQVWKGSQFWDDWCRLSLSLLPQQYKSMMRRYLFIWRGLHLKKWWAHVASFLSIWWMLWKSSGGNVCVQFETIGIYEHVHTNGKRRAELSIDLLESPVEKSDLTLAELGLFAELFQKGSVGGRMRTKFIHKRRVVPFHPIKKNTIKI